MGGPDLATRMRPGSGRVVRHCSLMPPAGNMERGEWHHQGGAYRGGHGMTEASDKPAVPERYDMPDLSGLFPKNSLNLILRALTGQEPVTTISGRPLWVNFVRLTDKAIHEYEAARAQLIEF